jgi:biopolymer transport protein ExbB/TolQ
MHAPIYLFADVLYVLGRATPEGKIIIVVLIIFSIFAWSVMASKAVQMRRAKKLNQLFEAEFLKQKRVMEMYDRQLEVTACPLFMVYKQGCKELDSRLKLAELKGKKDIVSLKSMEHVKRTLEGAVAQESLRLESGLILLAIAVSGAPFLGLLGTVWGVMDAFGYVAKQGQASLNVMAPGVAGALVTTVAGLLVAIPSMFGYNWLVHNLRVLTVNLDNFAQGLTSRMETEYLEED